MKNPKKMNADRWWSVWWMLMCGFIYSVGARDTTPEKIIGGIFLSVFWFSLGVMLYVPLKKKLKMESVWESEKP